MNLQQEIQQLTDNQVQLRVRAVLEERLAKLKASADEIERVLNNFTPALLDLTVDDIVKLFELIKSNNLAGNADYLHRK
jgi:hypothetical protein